MNAKYRRRKSDRPSRKRETKHSGPLGFLNLYLRQLQRYMVTGLLVWVPLLVTMWISWWVISKVGFGINRALKSGWTYVVEKLEALPSLGFFGNFEYSPIMGFLLAILLFLTTGFLTRYLVWRKVIASGETIVAKIPGFSKLYTAVTQIRDVFVRRDGAVFQEVILVEYPRPGLTVVGFITSREQGIVQQAAQKKMIAVFVPTTPNPTSGFLFYVPEDDLIPLDISVEDAMKLIVSGGAFLPIAQAEQPVPDSVVNTGNTPS